MNALETTRTVECNMNFLSVYFFDVYCDACNNEIYNIPICKASHCPKCESVLIPCFACIDEQFCKKCEI